MTDRSAARFGARLFAVRGARAGYRFVDRTPARRLLRSALVQRARAGLRAPVEEADVLAVLDTLEAAGVRGWLAGGWAADALVGEQTRPHGDLDLVVPADETERAVDALVAVGYRRQSHVASRVPAALLPDRVVLQDPVGRVVDLHGVPMGSWPDLPGIDEPFATGRVGGREVGCLSAAVQIAARRGYALEAEDDHDLERLRALKGGGSGRPAA